MTYSTVSFVRCDDALLEIDCFFHFIISQRTPLLQMSLYSDYQYFLYETISELRDKQMTFNQIADELNRKGYLTARGKVFKGNHVHSIVKKKRMRDERFYRKYSEEWSDISFEVMDKSLVNYQN
jgi:hypothetical protein